MGAAIRRAHAGYCPRSLRNGTGAGAHRHQRAARKADHDTAGGKRARPAKQYCWADSVLQAGVFVPKVWPCPSGAILTPIR